jgi:hypothetical protein
MDTLPEEVRMNMIAQHAENEHSLLDMIDSLIGMNTEARESTIHIWATEGAKDGKYSERAEEQLFLPAAREAYSRGTLTENPNKLPTETWEKWLRRHRARFGRGATPPTMGRARTPDAPRGNGERAVYRSLASTTHRLLGSPLGQIDEQQQCTATPLFRSLGTAAA